jgi:hypothetical protein
MYARRRGLGTVTGKYLSTYSLTNAILVFIVLALADTYGCLVLAK